MRVPIRVYTYMGTITDDWFDGAEPNTLHYAVQVLRPLPGWEEPLVDLAHGLSREEAVEIARARLEGEFGEIVLVEDGKIVPPTPIDPAWEEDVRVARMTGREWATEA